MMSMPTVTEQDEALASMTYGQTTPGNPAWPNNEPQVTHANHYKKRLFL